LWIKAATLAAELNRVATLEYELWSEQIEEAHKLCWDERNLSRMLEALRPLHDDMAKKDATTKCEQDFRTAYGNDLKAADDLGREYLVGKRGLQTSGCDNPAEEARLEVLADQVLRQYTAVRRRIQKQQIPMRALQLGYVSPFLAQRMAFRLEIPGSYRPRDKNPVTISCFEEGLDIVQSKQRPRKLYMWGDDGKRYGFLLKGGDDLRQDERVMQIFGLMNQAFVQSDERSVRKGGDIKRFNIVPLSSKAGLIELVPQFITMNELVQNFRQARKILPDIENKAMRRMAREPERLTLFQRVDLFRCMLETTDGRDIARILWLSSRNSEMWLEKRTHFSRTVATTSMAGYILGLGDRHPSNIMIEKDTGKVMHIDFGDCFEIAMQRRQYPETVPFRLTRMMVHALEPCGTGGHFRHMAVAIMRILRQQNMRTAVLSMMEAFIYDPLAKQSSVGDRDLARASQTADDDLSEGLTVIANERAEAAFGRVLEKLTGTDFDDTDEPLSAEEQVDRLVEQATNVENLCVLFSGYMSCW
jgi:serine/threonine-protein kinase mTOR